MEALKLYRNASPVFKTLFNDIWGDQMFQPVVRQYNTPLLNIKESKNEYEVTLAAPGYSKEDFKVQVENDVLTISVEKNEEYEEKDEKANYTRREFLYHNFSRSLTLPQNEVNTTNISASYVDGILKLVLPKREEAKPQPAKIISIQ